MARRNLFLVVSLLVMVGVLIAAVLWGGSEEGPTGPGATASAGAGQDPVGGAGEVRTAGATGAEDGVAADGRREVDGFEIPLPGGEPVPQVRVSGRLVDAEGAGVADVELAWRGGIVTDEFLPRFRDRQPPAKRTTGPSSRSRKASRRRRWNASSGMAAD